ncbi:MAG: hypothetical protein K2P99_01110 [Burkholderiales bacterium]|nr:hypothetical protein [Burkholderiales bacterium]
MNTQVQYPKTAMFPTVDYTKFNDDDYIGCNIVDLEFETMQNLTKFTDKFTAILSENKMVQTPELMVAHLCGYLGFFTVAVLGIKEAETLYPKIADILKNTSIYSYEQFSKYPVNSDKIVKEEKSKNLTSIRQYAPGSIVVQTVRLGRVIFDAMQELGDNSRIGITKKKQTELFCPQGVFIQLLRKSITHDVKQWNNFLSDYPTIYAVNQATIQLAWLIGYFAHLDKSLSTVSYLEYAVSCVKLYITYGGKYLAVSDKDWNRIWKEIDGNQ